MSKVGGALPAWYWPDGIPRRSPVPNQTLDRLIKRGSGKHADAPAIVSPAGETSFGELLATIQTTGEAIAVLAEEHATVALAEADAGESLMLMLAALAAGKRVLLCDLTVDPAATAAQLIDVGAAVVLTANEPQLEARTGGIPVITRATLDGFAGERAKLRPTKATAPALIIAANGEFAVHSQYSLAAMGVSLAAFVPELKGMALVAPPPLWHWESLAVTLAALINGAPVHTRRVDDPGTAEFEPSNAYTVLLRDQADEIVRSKHAPDGIERLAYVFVSTGHFDGHWRRALETACGREVLPLWGTATLGPAVAAHPTWFPLQAHGIPLVNVRVVPVDPGSGRPSVVPWEMLERAEIGVESPAAMVSFVREGADAPLRSGKILRTFVDASVDHVGVVELHKPRKHDHAPEVAAA